MSSRNPSSQSPPPVGSLIDGGALRLVSVLGYGGYGVVYRAVDPRLDPAEAPSYAVKCLIHSSTRSSSRQRRLHQQEINLHQRVSAHPHVVTLHRVIEEDGYTFIVMDYCPDGDLFAQILHHRRYLGHDVLIKHIFIQLLDAVGYCHSVGVFHRDLKPENVLCFNNGLRLALTDFGLATTDRVSEEFRTGSVYHMSPECQGGVFAPSGTYSTQYNDIWSLGIILLNLITGRNPWKSASASDPTFQAYLQDPVNFLPSVLPISDEVNDILLQTLDVNWRSRITLGELREAISGVHSFYAEDVVFEGSMARCSWEAGADIPEPEPEEDVVVEKFQAQPARADVELKSTWSEDSSPDIEFADQDAAAEDEDETDGWAVYPPSRATWGADTALRSRSPSVLSTTLDGPSTPHSTSFSIYSPALSDEFLSTRPEDGSVVAGDETMGSPMLSIDPFAKGANPSFLVRSESDGMRTAPENPSLYASSFYVPSPVSVAKPSYALDAPLEVALSTYPHDARYDGLRSESMSWTQASDSYTRVPESAVRDDLSSMEFHTPTLESSPVDTRPPWRSLPNSPNAARYLFPVAALVSSPAASSVPLSPPSNARQKHRSTNFFLPIRMPFRTPSPPVPCPPPPGPPPSRPLPPTPSTSDDAPSSAASVSVSASRAQLVKTRRGHLAAHAHAQPGAGQPERRRRRQPLRSARNWLLAGKRFAAAVAA